MPRAYLDLGATYDAPPSAREPSGTVGVISMAGYLADAGSWIAFNRKWWRLLRDNDVPDTIFHMNKFETRQGLYNGWSNAHRDSFIKKLLTILTDHVTLGVAGGVVTVDYYSVQQQETAAIAGVNTLQPITEPGITSLEPLTQAQRLAPPTRSSPRNWQNVDRAPTMSEIMARLEEISNPTVRGLAAKTFEKSWRKYAEATPGSEADPYITYPVYDNGVWRQTRALRSGGQTSASR